MPQQLIRCSACRERPNVKLAQVTWAWYDAEGRRHAYRQRLCIDCYAGRVLSLDREIAAGEPARCPGCGIDVDDSMKIVYATTFVPGSGRIEFAFPMCEAHALELHEVAQMGAEYLPDRRESVQGPAPEPRLSANDVWARLGIQPREGSALDNG